MSRLILFLPAMFVNGSPAGYRLHTQFRKRSKISFTKTDFIDRTVFAVVCRCQQISPGALPV